MLSLRARSLKPSPTLALAAKAKELASQGHNVISLSVGEPDWETFPSVAQAGIEAIKLGKTKYTAANGIPELRAEIARQLTKDLGLPISAGQVTATAGAKFSIFAAIQTLVDPQDEVLIPAPYWVSYPTMVELAAAKPVIIETQSQNKFKLTARELEQSISPRTKMLILNSPSNPTGEIYTRAELLEIAKVLVKFPRVLILCDDIYNRLVFDGSTLAPHILHVMPELLPRTIVVSGASKTYSMTGWRLGWAAASIEIVNAMTNYQSQTVSSPSTITQWAGVQALRDSEADVKNAVEVLKGRRDAALLILRKIPGMEVQTPGGAFYLWPKISSYFGKKFGNHTISNSADFCELLLNDQKVAAVPGIEFGAEGYMRISYTLESSKMSEAISRLAKFVGAIAAS